MELLIAAIPAQRLLEPAAPTHGLRQTPDRKPILGIQPDCALETLCRDRVETFVGRVFGDTVQSSQLALAPLGGDFGRSVVALQLAERGFETFERRRMGGRAAQNSAVGARGRCRIAVTAQGFCG